VTNEVTSRWEYNIKIEVCWAVCVEWIYVAQNAVHWRCLVKVIKYLHA